MQLENFRRELRNYVKQRVDTQDVDDVVQETFYYACRDWAKKRSNDRQFLFSICRKCIASYFRTKHRRRREVKEEEELNRLICHDIGSDPEACALRREEFAIVAVSLNYLTARQKLALYMRMHRSERSIAQMCRAVGWHQGTANRYAFNAINKIRKRLHENGQII